MKSLRVLPGRLPWKRAILFKTGYRSVRIIKYILETSALMPVLET